MKIVIDNESIKWLDENGTVIADYSADRDVPFLVYDGGKKEMTNEQIRNEINEATRDFRETTRKVNEALNHAAGRLNKCEQEAYDRGLNDCWEILWKVYAVPTNGGFTAQEMYDIFGDSIEGSGTYIGGVLSNLTPQQALAKFRAWEEKKAEEERKKQEEAEKIQIGDVVEAYRKTSDELYSKGIYMGTKFGVIHIFSHDDTIGADNFSLSVNSFYVKKTGEHVDILGALKK